MGELAQLLVSDVLQEDGVWVIRITDADDTAGTDHGKHLKNPESERDIPVHPELERLGFLSYAKAQKKAGELHLFPDCSLGADGTFSPFSKHFQRLLDSLGLKTRTCTVFHSFRHSFEDAMRDSGLQDSVRFRLAGRTLRHSSEDYGRGYSGSRLAKEIAKIRYLGLDLSHLY